MAEEAKQLSSWLREVAAWMRQCPFPDGIEYAKDVDEAIEAAEALERHQSEWEKYADHLRNCRHKSGDPFVNLHECTCGLRELYEQSHPNGQG